MKYAAALLAGASMLLGVSAQAAPVGGTQAVAEQVAATPAVQKVLYRYWGYRHRPYYYGYYRPWGYWHRPYYGYGYYRPWGYWHRYGYYGRRHWHHW